MRLVVQQFLSLDGVSQGPGSPDEDTTEGFTRGGWFVPFVDEALLSHVIAWAARADALLFGARTYRNFARDWPKMADPNDPIATALNSLPKYVVSKTLASADWAPSTLIREDAVGEIARLKKLPGRELQIHGSARLAALVLSTGLVDELRLAIAPVVVGQGRRLLANAWDQAHGFRLLSAATTPSGLAIHSYERVDAPRFGVYEPLQAGGR
jgi:dihydrofolate reductase